MAKENKDTRAKERRAGVDEADLTETLDWSAWTMNPLWNSVKGEVAPWHHDVTKHAFCSGVTNASTALKNYHASQNRKRKGKPVDFPKFKSRHSKQAFTLVDLNQQDGWFSEDSRHVRLVLPRSPDDPRIKRRRNQLQWLHTTESLRRMKKKVAMREWSVQAVTISFSGGRWQASFSVRQGLPIPSKTVKVVGPLVAVDLGVKHLATLSWPVNGVSDDSGHVANANYLDDEILRLARLDRRLSRCVKGSKNEAKLRLRRQRLRGRVTRTRSLNLHRLSALLAGSFEIVVIEDLDVAGLVKKTKTNSTKALRRSIQDAGFGEFRRQLSYKAEDRGHRVIVIDRYHPSSKRCSNCGETKAKLALNERVFECSTCGNSLDRDVNAARNIREEGIRLLTNEASTVAGHKPETLNADSRSRETGAPKCDGGSRNQGRTTHPTWKFLASV